MAQLQKTNSENRLAGFKVIGVMVALMWGLEVIDAIAGGSLDQYGIEPRDDGGLVGVVAAPFLHAGFGHLIANTVPFVVMGLVIAFKGPCACWPSLRSWAWSAALVPGSWPPSSRCTSGRAGWCSATPPT